MADFFFSHAGTCPTCDQSVNFVADGPYFRSTLKCDKCGSSPRSRAFMHALKTYFPNWRDMAIHESSPGWDVVSRKLVAECAGYIATQYDPSVPWGSTRETRMPSKIYRSEDLQSQTFPDATFDLMLTQDVFEHIMRPDLAIKEIARTLKPNGATMMSVPIVRKQLHSQRRARSVGRDGTEHFSEPQYHGNPMGGGSLVTIDWGYDIVRYLQAHSDLTFILLQVDNIDLGIRGDLNEILIGFKYAVPDLS
jgi:SAM-dependent methyltransferase